ncbi:MAG TPA: DUF5947 family protein [Isosphaeraceae bacterium]|jgi:hypothetical protein|nr:DUF5947 family protein [Isosphaeraceae bacterium]
MDPDPIGGRGLTALASLRRFVRPRSEPETERCALCGVDLAPEHAHLVEPASRRLSCACDACAFLLSGPAPARYRRVPRRVESLPGFRLSDETWEALNLPINLAFFKQSTPTGGVVALYPSPAGATESPVSASAWEALAVENPVLGGLEPVVEGLLVNRVGEARDYYRVGLDECYRLVGLIRVHWRGLSGGATAWEEIGRFFADLKERCAHA